MKLKEIWKKIDSKLSLAINGPPAANYMNAYDVQYIAQKVSEQTGVKVSCQDTMRINGRKNVGLVMAQDSAPDLVAKAEDAFIAAAKERSIDIERSKIVHYVPGTEPSTAPYRINPPSKTW